MVNLYKYIIIPNIKILVAGVSLIIVCLSALLIYTYHNTSKIVKHINNNSSCNNCIKNKLLCNNVLRYMFLASIIYIVLLIIFIITYIKTLNIYIILFIGVINTILFFMTLWFIPCLYYSFKNMNDINCPCIDKYRSNIEMLKKISLSLYVTMIVIFIMIIFIASFIKLRYYK